MSNHDGYRGMFLIMEDEFFHRNIVQNSLEEYGFLCITACSYAEAIGKLSRIKPERLNGVIVDLRMTPDGNDEEGNFFLDYIRGKESYAHIRKIVITGQPDIKPRLWSDAVIVKPVQWDGEPLAQFNEQLKRELDKAIEPQPYEEPDPVAEAPKRDKATRKVPNWMLMVMFVIVLLGLILAGLDYFSDSF